MTDPITSLAYAKLIAPDEINARPKTRDGIDELASMIAAKGLIQPLVVRPTDGGKFQVIDGRRRHQAIGVLIKDKRWPKTAAVPVLVRNEDDGEALETSLMANTGLPPHPVDQYEVFARLVGQGRTESEIATRFGLGARQVKQQLALGRLAPVIREAWRRDKITSEVAKVFAGAPEERQVAVWEKVKNRAGKDNRFGGGVSDYDIRRDLHQGRVATASIPPRTMALYVERGGTLTDDLFADARYVDDPALLAGVRRELAETIKGELAAAGWGWVSYADDLPRDWTWKWPRLDGEADWSTDDYAHVNGLRRRANAVPDDSDEAAALENEINVYESAIELRAWPLALRATAGAVLVFEGDGSLTIQRGVIRPTAGAAAPADGEEVCPDCGAVDSDDCETCGGAGYVDEEPDGDLPSVGSMTGEDEPDDAEPTITAALMQTLTEAQTRAAQRVMAADPKLALRALLASQQVSAWETPLKVAITDPLASRGVTSRAEADFGAVLASTEELTTTDMLLLLAPLVAKGVNLLASHATSRRDEHTALVGAMDGDRYLAAMREEFLPADYFARVVKANILTAIGEMREAGCAPDLAPVDVLADMKRGELAIDAAELAQACGWLPPELRHPDYALIAPVPTKRRTGKTAAAEQTGEPA